MVLRVCRQILRDRARRRRRRSGDVSRSGPEGAARSVAATLSRPGCTAWPCGLPPTHAPPRSAGAHASAEGVKCVPPCKSSTLIGKRSRITKSGRPSTTSSTRLPQSFRDPLILCYLDGLTQEQAAAQLRCPLGTVQSRLARGRAKLKTRLEKRGVGLSAIFAGANHLASQTCPAPQAWAEATVRLAMQFTQANGPAITAARTASVVLAEEAVRASF